MPGCVTCGVCTTCWLQSERYRGAQCPCAVRWCRRLHEELKGVGGSNRLAGQVAACTGKALRVLAEKAEYMASTGAALLEWIRLCIG